jgi:lysophospholipase L1-like esterase
VHKFAPKIIVTLAVVLIAGGSVAAILGARFTRSLYVQRAELRLNPGQAAYYARDNQGLGAPARPRVVFFGDSRVQSWRPEPLLAGHDLIWRGIAGQTTAQMAIRYESDVLALAPSTIVIQAGINDLVAGAAVDREDQAVAQLLQNLRSFAASAQAANARVCILTIVPPHNPSLVRKWLWSGDLSGHVAIANREIQALQGSGVTVIDVAGAMATQPETTRSSMMSDALHFNGSGYEFFNSQLTPCFGIEADAVQ